MMATVTVNLPDDLKAWLDAQVDRGAHTSADDIVRQALRLRREQVEPNFIYSEDDLDDLIAEGRSSGSASVTADEVFAEAERLLQAHRRRSA
jgi:antitoxin ParD1/3/4